MNIERQEAILTPKWSKNKITATYNFKAKKMFDYGLGTSLSSLTNHLTSRELIEALRDSEVQTFELNSQMFFYDYDGAVKEEFKAMLKETGKKVISYHIPFAGTDDLSNVEEKFRLQALSRFRAHYAAVKEFGCKYIVLHPSTEIRTNVKAERDERIKEISRIIGGAKITEKTITAATEMLDSAEKI